MHVNCPYCSTLYDIDPSELGHTGRDYQCITCNNVFHVPPQIVSPQAGAPGFPANPPDAQPSSQENLSEQSATMDLGSSSAEAGYNLQNPQSAPPFRQDSPPPFEEKITYGYQANKDHRMYDQSAGNIELQPPDITTFPMKDPEPPKIDFTLPKTSPAPTELPTGFIGDAPPPFPSQAANFSPPTSHLEFPSGTIPPPPTSTPADFNAYDSGIYGSFGQPQRKNSVYTGNLGNQPDQSIRIVREPSKWDDINKTNLWNVKIGEKVERGMQLIQLKSWIRAGTLRETDEVQEPGGSWIQAVESIELDRFFRLKAKIDSEKIAAVSSKNPEEIFCLNHTSDRAEWTCVGCDRPWCDDCVDRRVYGGAKVVMCPKCGDRCLPIERKSDVPKFWHQIPDLFQYPLRKHGPIMIILGMLLIYLGQLVALMTLGFGLFMAIALFGLVFAYMLRIVYKSSRVNDKGFMPDFPDVTDNFSREMVLPFFQVLFAFILYFIVPILVSYYFILKYGTFFVTFVNNRPVFHSVRATIVSMLFSIIGFYLFPMVMSIIAVHRTVLPAFNPIIIIRLIKRVPGPYTLMLIFDVVIIIGFSFAVYLVRLLLFKIGFSLFIIEIFNGFASFYLFAVLARLLGLFVRQAEDDLDWSS